MIIRGSLRSLGNKNRENGETMWTEVSVSLNDVEMMVGGWWCLYVWGIVDGVCGPSRATWRQSLNLQRTDINVLWIFSFHGWLLAAGSSKLTLRWKTFCSQRQKCNRPSTSLQMDASVVLPK